jgi:hypothetical protein
MKDLISHTKLHSPTPLNIIVVVVVVVVVVVIIIIYLAYYFQQYLTNIMEVLIK